MFPRERDKVGRRGIFWLYWLNRKKGLVADRHKPVKV